MVGNSVVSDIFPVSSFKKATLSKPNSRTLEFSQYLLFKVCLEDSQIPWGYKLFDFSSSKLEIRPISYIEINNAS